MDATTVYRVVYDAGVLLQADGDQLVARPAKALTPELLALLREHKPALLAMFTETYPGVDDIVAGAMRACDHHGDSPEAREEMRNQCLGTPPHLQADLLAHFLETYPTNRARMRLRDHAFPSLRPSGTGRDF